MPRPVGTFGGEGRTDPDRAGEIVVLKCSGQRWIVTQTTQECYVLRPMEEGRGALLLTPKELEEHAG